MPQKALGSFESHLFFEGAGKRLDKLECNSDVLSIYIEPTKMAV